MENVAKRINTYILNPFFPIYLISILSFTGDLLVKCGNDQQWWPRRVTIRGGQLLVGSVHGESKYGSVKIPLRKLSLSAGKLPNTLSLIRGQNILLTIQVGCFRI